MWSLHNISAVLSVCLSSFIFSQWFSDRVRLRITVFAQIWDNSPSQSSVFRKITDTACMFNILCGYNVTPNFSVRDLGKKNSTLHPGIYSVCFFLSKYLVLWIVKFMIWYIPVVFCRSVELLISDASFSCIITQSVLIFCLGMWLLPLMILQR
jgi:hypothetical protein